MQSWMIVMHWGVQFVFTVLIALSVWSISIMIQTSRSLRTFDKMEGLDEADRLIRARDWSALKGWAASQKGLHAGTVRAALETGSKDPGQVDRSIRSYLTLEKISLETGLTPLATLGSNAPFIGLFGTVLGIIQAFGTLGGSVQGDTSSIMVGISEALIATAIGLFVAIPAVIAYNFFSRKLKLIVLRCESLRDLYLSRLDS
jgi:biopolymer transport protein ExbB